MRLGPLANLAAAAWMLAAGAAAAEQAGAGPPDVERWEGPHGAAVYFIEAHELPIVDIKGVFRAGSARDGETPGLARLTARSLDEGADGLGAGELARGLEDAGARLSTSVGRDHARVHLRSLSRPEALDEALGLFERILARPSLEQEAVARERRQMEQGLRSQRQSASETAQRALYKAMYGDHPYATPPAGTEAGLAALDAEQVKAFFERYYVAANGALAIVGDLERAQAKDIGERLLRAIEAGEPAAALPQPPRKPERTEVRIELPGSQTAIMKGLPAVARGEEPTAYPLRVANQALGGSGMVSRLFHAMREERGLSYSTSSRLHVNAVRGPWIIRSQVQAEREGEALKVLNSAVERLAEDGLQEDELEQATRYLTGSFPVALASNAGLVRELGTMAGYDLPANHLARYIPRIEAVDQEAVAQALAERLVPERMVTVRVGPDMPEPHKEMAPK